MKLPLEGIKVVELGTHVVVPNASRFLADWGAEVIKVEGLEGELWRIVGMQYSTPVTAEENPLFAEQNANKKFAAINLKTPEGLKIIKDLIADADIFMTNVRLNSLIKLGLDYESLESANKKLIYAHLSGYGYEGPDAGRPGFDLATFWARTGTMCDWVSTGDFPFRPPGGFGDAATSVPFTAGILAALYAREKTGKGTFVTSSLYASALWFNQVGIISAAPQYGNPYPKSKMSPANPFSHIYKCKDEEWLIVTITNYNTDYDKFCRVLGLEEYVGDTRYNNLKTVKDHIVEFVTILNDVFLQKDRDEWVKLFNAADIVCEKLLHSRDVSSDPQAWANGYFNEVTYPSGNKTAFPVVPVQFKDYKVEKFELPGTVGRDTKEILNKYGYTDADFDQLAAKRIVK